MIKNKEYDLWSAWSRNHIIRNSELGKGEVITNITLFVKDKKWIANKTFEKWKKKAKDPLQPGKMAEDTMWITRNKNKIYMQYKHPLIYNKLTQKLEEYEYGRDLTQTLERIDGS